MMLKDFFIYTNLKNNKMYRILAISMNTDTKKEQVLYEPMYKCEYQYFTRSLPDFEAKFKLST